MHSILAFQNIKKIVIASAVSLMLALGVAAAGATSASAQANTECSNGDALLEGNICGSLDNSDNSDSPTNGSGVQANNGGQAYQVSGDCSGVFNVDQANSNSSNSVSSSTNTNTGNRSTQNSSSSVSNSSSQGNDVSFSPDCSTTNVSQSAAPAKAQVWHAPRGAVNAGAGGAVEANSGVSAIVGLVGSAGVMAAGVVLRRQFEM